MTHTHLLPLRGDLLDLHRLAPPRYPFLLQSVAHGTAQARFDILCALPEYAVILQADGRLVVQDIPAGETRVLAAGTDFLATLDALWRDEVLVDPAPSTPTLPFRGGWFLYLGYELAQQIEPVLNLPRATISWPTALAVRVPAAVVQDHATGDCYAVAERAELLATLEEDAARAWAQEKVATPSAEDALLYEELTADDPAAYLTSVQRIIDYIQAGDVFQVNLSRAWRGRLRADVTVAEVYACLRRTNPAPFAALMRWGNEALASSSPERLVCAQAGWVQVRPIAGTRPRGTNKQADTALAQTLMAHPKERAEHIMLIDLERNDLGRVCVPGTVSVDELMVLESYSHVHHIVSNVRGRLRATVTPGELIRAVFPGGTITGCPKVRCMEIIAELEGVARGPYTGALGYLNRDGSLDLNILIRTLQISGAQFTLRAGAGIVADSHAPAELAETCAKARGLLLALGARDVD